MLKKILLVIGVFAFAFAILSISILESATVTHSYGALNPGPMVLGEEVPEINYQLPYGGSVLPDNPLWTVKALRDKVWFFITPSPIKKAELALLFSDKRLASARTLFVNKKSDLAISTLTKGEKYLEIAVNQESIARSEGYNTNEFLSLFAVASLKHRQVIESLMPLVPEAGRPIVIKSEDYSKNSFKAAADALNSKGMPIPINPFNGD